MLIGALLECADIMIWGCKSPEGQSQNTGSTSEGPKRTDRLRSQQQPRHLQGPGKRAACGQGFQQPQPAGPPARTSKSSRDVPKLGSHTSRTRKVQHGPGAGASQGARPATGGQCRSPEDTICCCSAGRVSSSHAGWAERVTPTQPRSLTAPGSHILFDFFFF